MDNFTAIGIAEGFVEAESQQQVLEAWSHIGKTGLYKSLQGFFGRTLFSLVEGGYLSEDFEITNKEIEIDE